MNEKNEKLEIIDALEMVKQQIITPDTWVKEHYALNEKGYYCIPDSPDACKWCLSGAIIYVLRSRYPTDKVREVIIENMPRAYGSIADFNDDKNVSHTDVINLIDLSIISVAQSIED